MTMNKEIPEKFFISGHSYGGFISSLFACAHPDRIDGLFLNSPIGAEAEPEDFDPLTVRLTSSETAHPSWAQRIWISNWENNRTPCDVARSIPKFILLPLQRKIIGKDLNGYPEHHKRAVANYYID